MSTDLPDAQPSRAVLDMENQLAATAALIIVIGAATLGTLPLAAAATLMLGMALDQIIRRDH